MSQTLLLQKAQHEYRQFIRGLSAFRARHVEIGEPDPPVEPFVEVQPKHALDAFLIRHPEYNQFREQLLDVRSEQEKFFFIEERWQEIIATNSV